MEAIKLFKKLERPLDKGLRHIISTKALNEEYVRKLQKTGCFVESYDIMTILFDINSQQKSEIEAKDVPYIFTSKNGIYSAERFGLKAQKCYAISPVTSFIAEEAGYQIIGKAKNAKELAKLIAQNNEKEIIHLTCPDRRTEMKTMLDEEGINVLEYETYFKIPKPKSHNHFDALLVFAPSHLKAFTTLNTIKSQAIYCIGKTTAEFAKSQGYTHVKYCEISSEKNLVELALQDMTNE